MNLIDSTFRRICEIASMSKITIKELPSGCISFCVTGEDNAIRWSSWEWENKEQFLISDDNDVSLFLFLANVDQSSYFKDKINLSFINLCETLKDCKCIEELALKMDLMGI
jgi:spermidine synthase